MEKRAQEPLSLKETEHKLDIRELLDKYLKHFWWFMLSVIVCLLLAYLYIHYKVPVYESTATVLIERDDLASGSPELNMLKDIGLTNGGSVLEDEIELFKSRSLMERVVSDLKLNWKYENLGTKTGFVRSELFDNTPVTAIPVDADSSFLEGSLEFELTVNSGSDFRVSDASGVKNGSYAFGTLLTSPWGAIRIKKTSAFNQRWIGKTIRVTLTPFNEVVSSMQRGFSVSPASKEANLIILRIRGNEAHKNNAVLNRLIAEHEENTILKKNEIVRNTTNFINDRMRYIASELSEVELEGEKYKSRYHLIDVTSDAASYLEKEGDIEKRLMDKTVEKNIVKFMIDFLDKENGFDRLLPSNLGLEDVSIVEMTDQYNKLVLERNQLVSVSGVKNPGIARLESQLSNMRSSLESSLRNLNKSLDLKISKLESEEGLYQSKIKDIPRFEREYRDILRQQQIKETLYLFLLQKREENEISLAATVSNMQVVDQAFTADEPISPKPKVLFLAAFLIGLLVPVLIIYLMDLLNRKVKNRADLEKLGLNVLAEIPEFKDKEEAIVLNKPHAATAEAFRVLRAGLSFILPMEEQAGGKVISITSTLGGEGKTFTSINLAYIYAAIGKKVLLLGMDLRKPRLSYYLGLEDKPGLSNFLSSSEIDRESMVSVVERNGHRISVIASGDIPPNPSELLMSPKLGKLLEELRAEYDVIILDNAPIGLVADALITNHLCDMTLFLVRANTLDRRMLNLVSQLNREKKLKRLYLVLNSVKQLKGGYYYTYYDEEVRKKSFLKRFRKEK
jgi:capsular exopolysaccharide synthesis family protein